MPPIDSMLSDVQLANLRGAYDAAKMADLLSSKMPSLDPDTAGYVAQIRQAFYDRCRMEPKDRERCLIGILASRDAGLNLALHVYVGLMEGLSPHDVADVVFLGGIYTGVDRISDGLDTVTRTLTVLARLAGRDESREVPVGDVAAALVAAFKPPLPSPT